MYLCYRCCKGEEDGTAPTNSLFFLGADQRPPAADETHGCQSSTSEEKDYASNNLPPREGVGGNFYDRDCRKSQRPAVRHANATWCDSIWVPSLIRDTQHEKPRDYRPIQDNKRQCANDLRLGMFRKSTNWTARRVCTVAARSGHRRGGFQFQSARPGSRR